jgi:hypothetical protein
MTTPMSGAPIEWFLARDGRQHGPLADAEMTKFLELGHLRAADLVWRAGFPEWRAASDVFDLNEKTLIGARKTQPAAVTAPAPAVIVAPAVLEQAVQVAAAPEPAQDTPVVTVAVASASTSSTEAFSPQDDTASPGAKTGIVDKKPLETPLLSPAQLAPVAMPAAPVPAPSQTSVAVDAAPVTSLNERLQRAASERIASVAAPAAIKVAAAGAMPVAAPAPAVPVPNAPAPQPVPARMQPLPELRAPAPVPLMPLEPRTVTVQPTAVTAAATGEAPATRRKKTRKPADVPGSVSEAPRSRGRLIGIAATLAIIVGGGAWLATGSRSTIASMIGMGGKTNPSAPNAVAAAKAPAAAAVPAKATSAVTVAPTEAPTRAAPFVTAAKTADAIDADLKRSAVWQVIAREFPEWHRDRVGELAKLAAEKRDPAAISKHIAEAIVALRRKFADQALAAPPEKLRAVATTFLDNLKSLSQTSTDACYGFISQGETYPAVIDLMRQGDRTEALHKQATAVFDAIAEGRKSPQSTLPPRKADYDALAAELTARGWSQADLQMFSDSRALGSAPPEQVCKMVQDWFGAQLAIKDPQIQLRLLIESLRPVVAG